MLDSSIPMGLEKVKDLRFLEMKTKENKKGRRRRRRMNAEEEELA